MLGVTGGILAVGCDDVMCTVRFGMVEKQAPPIRDLYHGINSLGRKPEINSKPGLTQTFGFKIPSWH